MPDNNKEKILSLLKKYGHSISVKLVKSTGQYHLTDNGTKIASPKKFKTIVEEVTKEDLDAVVVLKPAYEAVFFNDLLEYLKDKKIASVKSECLGWDNNLMAIIDYASPTDKVKLFNHKENTFSKVSEHALRKTRAYLGDNYFFPRIYPAYIEYDPYSLEPKPHRFIDGEKVMPINTYIKPDYFEYLNTVEAKIPPKIEWFLKHLVDRHEPTYVFILDLLSELRRRRVRGLVTFYTAAQQVGKSVIIDFLIKRLVGDTNYFKVTRSFFSKQFNSEMENKQVLFFEELFVKNDEEEAYLKDVTFADTYAVEYKGVDVGDPVKLHSTICAATNKPHHLRLSGEGLRYIIPNLTSINLESRIKKELGIEKDDWFKLFLEEINDDHKIAEFYKYLEEREVINEVKCIKTKSFYDVKYSCVEERFQIVLDFLLVHDVGYKISFKELLSHVKKEYGQNGKGNKRRIFTPESLNSFVQFFEWRGIYPVARVYPVETPMGDIEMEVESFVGLGAKYTPCKFDRKDLWLELPKIEKASELEFL